MLNSRRPTLRDVARESGLSVTQVSRALNGHSDVASATRHRVQAAADRIGYHPNLAARRLKQPETGAQSLGLVLGDRGVRFSDPFFGELLTWMVDEAAASGFELQLSTPPADEHPIAAYERAIRLKRVDGFIVLRLEVEDERVEYLLRERFPFVTFGRMPSASGFPTVDEHDDAMQPVVDHLVELGHRDIACLTEPEQHSKSTYRLQSLRRAATARQVPLRKHNIAVAGFHEDSGHACASQLLARADRPTAIVAFNDLLAIGVLRAAADAGIDVPKDLSVVGFDDIHAARLVAPPLTTLRQPVAEVGRLLVQRLLASIESNDVVAEDCLITPELIVRSSTGPAARLG